MCRLFKLVLNHKKRKLYPKNIGKNVKILDGNVFSDSSRVAIGNDVQIGYNNFFQCENDIFIGSGTVIANDNIFRTSEHYWKGADLKSLPFDNRVVSMPIKIGENVWIGSNCTIMPGVMIGNGAVIGGNTVVRMSVPECAVVIGNPATIVKYRDKKEYDFLRNKHYLGSKEKKETISINEYKKEMK